MNVAVADDWVKILTLVGSVVLFIGSLRGQKWTRKQVVLQDNSLDSSAASTPSSPVASPVKKPDGKRRLAAPGVFEGAVAKAASEPYFDRPAYLLFCVGFLIASVASAIDIYSHRSIQHVLGLAPVIVDVQTR